MTNANLLHKQTRPFCVFTSAGDHSNIAGWIPPDGQRNWDLIVVFYGKSEAAYKALLNVADIVIRAKGNKFGFLHMLVNRQPGLFKDYKYFWIADDDLIFKSGNLNKLFEMAYHYGFLICQPAFDPAGRISHSITRVSDKGTIARLVNFVETTCPVFEADMMRQFISVFDPDLVAWGTDWWWSQMVGNLQSHRMAIIDTIVVLNPLEEQRTVKTREIENLMSSKQRFEQWQRTSASYKLSQIPHKVFAEIYPPPPPPAKPK